MNTINSSTSSPSPAAPVLLSLVVPVYNESQRLDLVIGALTDPIDWGIFTLHEIIFVNDGSRDNSLALLRRYKPDLSKITGAPVKIITYRPNRGKGAAIRAGMLAATGDYILMMDADMSTPMSELKRLQAPARRHLPVVVGTRKAAYTRVEKSQPWHRQFLGHVFTWLTQLILGSPVSDFTCGFKLFRCDVAQAVFTRARIDRWAYDSEIIFLAERLGYQVREVVVRWRNDDRSHVHAFRDGIRSFLDLLRIRLYFWTGRYRLRQP